MTTPMQRMRTAGISAISRRTPSTLGMQPRQSGALGPTRPMGEPAERSKRLGNMYDRLITGDNPAADLAERSTFNELGNQRAERQAEFADEAAQMGLKPGDIGFRQAQSRAMAPLNSQGSSIMANLAGQRLSAQRQAVNDAAGFNLGQQEFGESAHRFDVNRADNRADREQDFGESVRRFDLNRADNRADQGTRNMFDLLGMSDLLSEGQAGALKSALGGSMGLGGDQWNQKDPDQFTQAVTEMASFYKATRPGMSDQEAMALAQKDIGAMNPAEFFRLAANPKFTGAPGEPGDPAAGEGGEASPWEIAGDAAGTLLPKLNFIRAGTGHIFGEAGRGFRDMGRGDVLGGAGRVLASPFRGATHGVMDTGRKMARTGKRVWDLIT